MGEITINLSEYRGQHVDISIRENRIIGYIPEAFADEPDDILVTFHGKGNIFYIEDDEKCKVDHITVSFMGDNGIIYLSKNRHTYTFDAIIEEGGACWFGRDVFMNKNIHGRLNIHVQVGHTVMVGHDCLFSLDVCINTDANDNKPAGDILLGNHVWIGQKVRIFGSSTVDGNVVIGANASFGGQHLTSNAVWITKDETMVKANENVVFGKDSIRSRTKEKLKLYDVIDEKYLSDILNLASHTPMTLLSDIKKTPDSSERLDIFKKYAETFEYVAPKYSSIRKKLKEKKVLEDNVIYGDYEPNPNLWVEFSGKGNVLIIEPGVKVGNIMVHFSGDRGLIFIGKSREAIYVELEACTDANVYLGRDFQADEAPYPLLQATENQTVLIGNQCKFGKGTWSRTSDQHPIWDIDTRKRINHGKGIFVGDKETVPPYEILLKGQNIGGMKGILRRDYLYKKAFNKLSSLKDMKKRIKWMLTLSESGAASRIQRVLKIGSKSELKKTVIE